MPKNTTLWRAKIAKNDEFYTQLSDIENELRHYKEHFRWKTVLCNCDDPRVSNFFHYFAYNFEQLWLKRLITTCYKNQNSNLFTSNNSEKAVYLVYDWDKNWNNIPDIDEIWIHELKWDGDFRSEECIELLKQSDIVVTNPPFSLFREYVWQLIEYDKKFVIIGNPNAITYKEFFPLLRDNKVWVGYKSMGSDMLFGTSKEYEQELREKKKEGSGYRIVGGKFFARAAAIWFTNLDIKKRHEDLITYKKYNPDEYRKYDNYDAIDVSQVSNIPCDYDGVMWVPITFLDKYNPEQFELVGRDGDLDLSVTYDFFTPPIQDLCNKYKKANNTWRVQNAYMVNNGVAKTCFKRLFIRRKK